MKKISLALLAGASWLGAGANEAAAIDGVSEPRVIYAAQAEQPAPAVRMASNNMGGGFIQFLFGEPPQGGRYQQQQPMYQQQPEYGGRRSMLPPMDPQQPGMYRREEAADPAQRPVDPRYAKQLVDYHGKEDAGTVVIDTPNKFL